MRGPEAEDRARCYPSHVNTITGPLQGEDLAMKWSEEEIQALTPIMERFEVALAPLNGKRILALCSAAGDFAFWLARKMKSGLVTGLELNPELLALSQQRAREENINKIVSFETAQLQRIPYGDESFDAVVSEFVLFPTPSPTQIGQPEMARVLRPGGTLALTDVIVTRSIPPDLRNGLTAIGLDYLCDGTADDFRKWMRQAGLVKVDVSDLTPVVRDVWEKRRAASPHGLDRGFATLLEHPEYRLGKSLFYIYAQGEKP